MGIYISYRRQDAAGYATRLRDDLAERYGIGGVFLDIGSLGLGEDFRAAVDRAVASCEAMLVVIGPEWLSATDLRGQRRLESPEDFVRSEIAAALKQGKRVVPVLVGHATMPGPEDLPEDLRPLAMRQVVFLGDTTWATDLRGLFGDLDTLMGGPIAQQHVAPREGPSLPSGSPTAQPATAGRHDVFVSHSTQDRVFVDQLVVALERQGRHCWVAPRDIPPGVRSWAAPIVTAIANSRLVLVLLTAQSIPSDNLIREVTLADEEKIPMLPVTLDGTKLSPGLRYFFTAGQRLDLASLTQADQIGSILPAVDRQLQTGA